MIRLDHVSKRYAEVDALTDVSFTAEPGRVTGFVGPTGAGKSTALRILVGLVKPTSGRATIEDQAYASLPVPPRLVGVLIDADSFHRGRSGRETLILAARAMGMPTKVADTALDRVGLTAREGRARVGTYSLGMRQRLGLAQALLGDPQTLVLDEPANGLDPQGVRWLGDVLREYAGRGRTVLLSSHRLAELSEIADDLVFLLGGRVVAAGSQADLLYATGAGRATIARADDVRALRDALTAADLDPVVSPDGSVRVDADPRAVGRIAQSAGVPLSELSVQQGISLEDYYFSVSSHADRSVA